MSDLPATPSADRLPPAAPPIAAAVSTPAARPASERAASARPLWILGVLVAVLAAVALGLAWRGQQRVKALEQELVRRQQSSADQATEARLLAKQADEMSRGSAAKAALLEERVAEVSAQRVQLEDVLQSLTRSRDDGIVTDIDASLRVAIQHSAMTGSAEPLVAALRAADDRVARANQPRLEPVRRALAHDMDRIRGEGVTDLGSLAAKLDEAVRLVDEAPMLVVDGARRGSVPAPAASAALPRTPEDDTAFGWLPVLAAQWWSGVWAEVRALVRVTRIDQPEAMLLAPEQGFFLRENLKLRLLNARLALMSRQPDSALRDLQTAGVAVDRYFDRTARKTAMLAELLHGVAAQAHQSSVPRPDETLAALATAAAGR